MTRLRALGAAVLVCCVGGCEERHGFLKVGSNALFGEADRLKCGEAEIVPQPGGYLDAFVTLKPQDCTLTIRRSGDWLGAEICPVHVDNNKITSIYLLERRGGFSCSRGGD